MAADRGNVCGRVAYSQIAGRGEITISAWKYWLFIVFWPPCAPLWVRAVTETLSDQSKEGQPCTATYVFLAIWALIGCLFTVEWLRTVLGREVITVSLGLLTIRHEILPGIGLSRRFDISRVRSLATKGPFGPPNMLRLFLRSTEDTAKFTSDGSVCFSYDGKIREFGPKLTEQEASFVVDTLSQHLPATAL